MTDALEEHTEYTERYCISAAIHNAGCAIRLVKAAKEEMFSNHWYRRAFAAIKRCHDLKIDVCVESVSAAMAALSADVSQEYARSIVQELHDEGTLARVDLYLPTLVSLYQHREIVKLGKDIQVIDYKEDMADVLRDTKKALVSLGVEKREGSLSLKEMFYDWHNGKSFAQVLREKIQPEKGFSVGFNKINLMLGGLVTSRVIIIAARTGIGKTEFACQLSANAMYTDARILVLTTEMKKKEYAERFFGIFFKKNAFKVKNFNYEDSFPDYVQEEMETMGDVPENVRIELVSGMNIEEIELVIEQHIQEHGTNVVILDHIGHVASYRPGASIYEATTYNSNHLKTIAMNLDVCVIVIAQLNRAAEGRNEQSPRMTDIRNSGEIEQDANQIILLSRDDVKRTMTVDICKNRHSPYKEPIVFKYDVDTQTMEEMTWGDI